MECRRIFARLFRLLSIERGFALMRSKQEVSTPVYRQIAIDIAKNIAIGKYSKGQKLSGRSVLASHYGVSPETIRKAVFILKDVGILETEKGSGVEIISVAKAIEFVERYNEIESISNLKNEIVQWANAQTEQTSQIIDKINRIINATERLNTSSPLNPYQVKITDECRVIGKTICELQFWHNTGGTIIAIRRGERLIVSPGPYATFCIDDTVFIVGNDASYVATVNLLFN